VALLLDITTLAYPISADLACRGTPLRTDRARCVTLRHYWYPTGLTLAPAERADLIVDLRPFRGGRLRLVNTAGAPFDGAPWAGAPGAADPANRLPHPEVLEFHVSPRRVADPFALPRRLSSVRRLTPDRLPPGHARRLVALVEEADGMLTLHELAEAGPADTRTGEPLIAVVDKAGAERRYRTVAARFADTTNWFVAYGSTEVWGFLNLTRDTHPMHVHLVQFQVLARDRYATDGFDAASGATATPVTYLGPGAVEAGERGWKDTVRVDPGELVSVAATFDGYTGRYMYHCHLLEHEDHDMMRPFVVAPAAALAAMGAMPGMPMTEPAREEMPMSAAHRVV
jgi:FtsP/CotA-like multicopper oxidase with cupredoxin domain